MSLLSLLNLRMHHDGRQPNYSDYKKTCANKIVPDSEVTKRFSGSTQLSVKFILQINVKMPTTFHSNFVLETKLVKPQNSQLLLQRGGGGGGG